MRKRPIAVVLLSGGMDSCVTLATAITDYDVAVMHANYGQRTETRELRAFHDIANHYDIGENRRLIVDQKQFADIGGSSLTDASMRVPQADLTSQEVPTTYVPFRNGNLLSAATSWAEVLGASAIFVGAVEEDSSGYPDCRREFYDAYEIAIDVGTKPETQIKIITPIIEMNKGQIVSRGMELSAPLHLTWSCYQAEDEPCGTCDSCALRARGFADAEVADPIISSG